jgi:hypothetical protein
VVVSERVARGKDHADGQEGSYTAGTTEGWGNPMGRRLLIRTAFVAALAPSLVMGEGSAAPLEQVQRVEGSWTPPVRIAAGDPKRDATLSSPIVSLAPEGDITVVWSREGQVLSRTRQAGASWGPVRSVGMGFPADLDVDADGDVTLVWTRFLRDDRSVLFASRRPDGGRWSPPHRLSRVPVIRAAFLGPSGVVLDVNPRGDAFVAWAYGSPEHTNIDYRVEVSYRRNGGTWNPRTRVGPLGMRPQGAVISSDGVPTVLAKHEELGRLRAFRRSGGGWHPLGAPTSRRVSEAELTLGGDGTQVLATWTAFGLQGSWLTADGWSPPQRLNRHVGVSLHATGVDRSGTATIAWESPRGWVQVTRWVQGRDPGVPRTLARGGAEHVSVSVAGDDTATVSWAGRVPGTRFDSRARAVRRPPAGPWSRIATVSRRRNIDSGSLTLDSWPSGRAALAWVNENFKAIWLATG